MNFIFLIGGIIWISIFSFSIWKYFKFKEESMKKLSLNFVIIGLFYLILSLSSFIWFFKIMGYLDKDFLIVYSLVIFLQNLFFFRLIYKISSNKKLFYFLGFYLLSLPLLFFLYHFQSYFFLIFSFLFSLLIFISFTFREDIYKKVGYIGIFYSTVSLIFSLFLLVDFGDLMIFSLLSSIGIFYLLYFFIEDLGKYPLNKKIGPSSEKPYFFSLISNLIFIITLTNFIFIGTIGIHEFGHYGLSKIYDCDYRKIVYDGDLFHTEVLCEDEYAVLPVALGGIFLPFVLGIFLIFVGGHFLREVALLIFGFNFLSISRDLSMVGASNLFSLLSIFSGTIFLMVGIFLLAKSRMEFEIYEDKDTSHKYI